MSHVLILHGIYGNPSENWFPWLKDQLEQKGMTVDVPHLPTHEPLLPEHWWSVLFSYEGHINEDTIIIAHSLGVAFALKIIEKYKIKAALFVAPAWGKTDNEFDPVIRAVADQKFDWEIIKDHCLNFTIFHSDNDPYLKMERAEKLSGHLNTEVNVVSGAGHFNKASGYTEFPQLLQKIEKLI
ncbi:MAG: alpha/beta hydrolase [Kiritimatiellales bacterium]|nr:alpha/beta hydrolase [Kiritimatiellales bacterium]